MIRIPSYKIHNVLKVYCKQVNQELGEKDSDESVNRVRVSAEGKREAIIDRVADEIVQKIKEFASPDKAGKNALNLLENASSPPKNGAEGKGDPRFTFNTIGADNVKTTRALSLEDSDFFISRLEELANASAAKKPGA